MHYVIFFDADADLTDQLFFFDSLDDARAKAREHTIEQPSGQWHANAAQVFGPDGKLLLKYQ